MLPTTNYRDLKVVDIARAAGTSPATFYQYFPDVEAAVLVLAEEMIEDGARLPALVRSGAAGGAEAATAPRWPWSTGSSSSGSGTARCCGWSTSPSAEGDPRFHNVRTRLLNGVTVALREVIAATGRRAAQPTDVDPMATAGVLVADAGPRVGPPLRLRVLGHPHRRRPPQHGRHGVLVGVRPAPADLRATTA